MVSAKVLNVAVAPHLKVNDQPAKFCQGGLPRRFQQQPVPQALGLTILLFQCTQPDELLDSIVEQVIIRPVKPVEVLCIHTYTAPCHQKLGSLYACTHLISAVLTDRCMLSSRCAYSMHACSKTTGQMSEVMQHAHAHSKVMW